MDTCLFGNTGTWNAPRQSGLSEKRPLSNREKVRLNIRYLDASGTPKLGRYVSGRIAYIFDMNGNLSCISLGEMGVKKNGR